MQAEYRYSYPTVTRLDLQQQTYPAVGSLTSAYHMINTQHDDYCHVVQKHVGYQLCYEARQHSESQRNRVHHVFPIWQVQNVTDLAGMKKTVAIQQNCVPNNVGELDCCVQNPGNSLDVCWFWHKDQRWLNGNLQRIITVQHINHLCIIYHGQLMVAVAL